MHARQRAPGSSYCAFQTVCVTRWAITKHEQMSFLLTMTVLNWRHTIQRFCHYRLPRLPPPSPPTSRTHVNKPGCAAVSGCRTTTCRGTVDSANKRFPN